MRLHYLKKNELKTHLHYFFNLTMSLTDWYSIIYTTETIQRINEDTIYIISVFFSKITEVIYNILFFYFYLQTFTFFIFKVSSLHLFGIYKLFFYFKCALATKLKQIICRFTSKIKSRFTYLNTCLITASDLLNSKREKNVMSMNAIKHHKM